MDSATSSGSSDSLREIWLKEDISTASLPSIAYAFDEEFEASPVYSVGIESIASPLSRRRPFFWARERCKYRERWGFVKLFHFRRLPFLFLRAF